MRVIVSKIHLLVTALVLSIVLASSARSQPPDANAAFPAPIVEKDDVPATDCDKYAASPLDPERKTEGVSSDKINADLAVPACETAVAQYPQNGRLMYQLGRAYYQRKDFISASVQYRKAAELGNLGAQTNLSYMYSRGEGVAKDPFEALRWVQKAADKGLPVAQSNLGSMYLLGEGVQLDYIEAEKWFRKAANQGLSFGQLNLGRMYWNGQGVAQDYSEAARWFRKAADQGNSEAQTRLGNMYLYGRGEVQDFVEAAKWFHKAADQNDADAKKFVAKFDAASLDSNDLPSVVGTYKENELRFARDFRGRRFLGTLPFLSAAESPFEKGMYRVSFGKGAFLSSLDCITTSSTQISAVVDWNKGDPIHIDGIVDSVALDTVRLEPCKLSK